MVLSNCILIWLLHGTVFMGYWVSTGTLIPIYYFLYFVRFWYLEPFWVYLKENKIKSWTFCIMGLCSASWFYWWLWFTFFFFFFSFFNFHYWLRVFYIWLLRSFNHHWLFCFNCRLISALVLVFEYYTHFWPFDWLHFFFSLSSLRASLYVGILRKCPLSMIGFFLKLKKILLALFFFFL